ncbi:MAG: hypothetical protein ACK2U9_18930 [Anaerolineae bacterium]
MRTERTPAATMTAIWARATSHEAWLPKRRAVAISGDNNIVPPITSGKLAYSAAGTKRGKRSSQGCRMGKTRTK